MQRDSNTSDYTAAGMAGVHAPSLGRSIVAQFSRARLLLWLLGWPVGVLFDSTSVTNERVGDQKLSVVPAVPMFPDIGKLLIICRTQDPNECELYFVSKTHGCPPQLPRLPKESPALALYALAMSKQ